MLLPNNLFEKLLTNGYFPKELPPCFSSASLLRNGKSFFDEMEPSQIKLQISPGYVSHSIFKKRIITGLFCADGMNENGEGVSFYGDSTTTINRTLNIPNPFTHILASNFISSNWKNLDNFINLSKISKSKPEEGSPFARALRSWDEYHDKNLDRMREDIQEDKKYLVKVDVKDFYPSLSLQRIKEILYEVLTEIPARYIDHLLLFLSGNLDRGIPLGPDWSYLLAELALTKIDLKIAEGYPDTSGFRFYDDFEFYTNTRLEAEILLDFIGTQIQENQLNINWDKTGVFELPINKKNLWQQRLESVSEKIENVTIPTKSFKDFIDIAKFYENKYPQDPVRQWVIKNLKSIVYGQELAPENLEILMSYLTTNMSSNTESITEVINIICMISDSCDISEYRKNLETSTNNTMYYAVNDKNENAVLWGMYTCLIFDLVIYETTAMQILTLNNPLIIITVMDAVRQGLFPPKKQYFNNRLSPLITRKALYGPDWILVYELIYQGWAAEYEQTDCLDHNFSLLKKYGINFYTSPKKIVKNA